MLNPNGQISMLRGEVFNYLDGDLLLEADGSWHKHASYPTYELAYAEAEEIVDEYYAMGQGEEHEL